jgi:hypothetical protein
MSPNRYLAEESEGKMLGGQGWAKDHHAAEQELILMHGD